MAYNNFFDDIKNKEDLVSKLLEKGRNHDKYTFYCDKVGIWKTIEGGLSIRLTNGKHWNDEIDKKNLSNDGRIRFVKSFTYSKSENIAMWMLYSDPSEEGYMISFTKSIMNKVFEVEKIEVKVKETNNTLCTLHKENFNISLIDIVYVGEGEKDNTFALKKSIYGVKSFDASVLDFDLEKDKYDYFAKSYGWAYENECRLVIDFDKKYMKNDNVDYSNYECYVDLKLVLRKNYIKAFLFPNNDLDNIEEDVKSFFENNKISIENSKYKGKINWSLKNKYIEISKNGNN